MTVIEINERTKAGKSLLNMALIMSEKYSGILVKKLIARKESSNRKSNTEIPFVTLSQSSLNEEWLSPEDSIWDSWASEKMNKKN